MIGAIIAIIAILALAILLKLTLDFPIIGGTLPRLWWRRLPLNRDGSYVDTGKSRLDDECGFYYIEVFSLEWLGFGQPFGKAYVRLTKSDEIVQPDFDVAGG